MDAATHARNVLAENRYAVIASAVAGGQPWATPVWFAYDGLDRLLWISSPRARHSRLIAANPQVAITVFDTSRASGRATAFYATGRAGECPDNGLEEALALYNQRSQQQQFGTLTRADLSGDPRLFTVTICHAWVLEQDSPVDQCTPVPR